MKVVMLGAPGAGKGTQAKRLATKYNVPHISTGDIFRANIKNETELGKKVKGYLDRGELVPDELTCDLLVDRIDQEDCANGYVLDGFPRTIPQAQILDVALAKGGSKLDFAIDIEVSDIHIIKRMGGRRACLACGRTYHVEHIPPAKEGVCDDCQTKLVLRDDDVPETVKKRLDIYHEQTQPLIDYYNSTGILKTVDGIKDMDEVFAEIVSILGA